MHSVYLTLWQASVWWPWGPSCSGTHTHTVSKMRIIAIFKTELPWKLRKYFDSLGLSFCRQNNLDHNSLLPHVLISVSPNCYRSIRLSPSPRLLPSSENGTISKIMWMPGVNACFMYIFLIHPLVFEWTMLVAKGNWAGGGMPYRTGNCSAQTSAPTV